MLDVPEDVCHGEHEFDAADFWIDPATLKAQARRTRPDPAELERAARLIAKAERPLLLVGGGIHISEGYDALRALAEGHGIPVAHTMSGKGAIACTHPLSAGLFGRYSRIANELVAASDALIVVGCKLGEIPTRRFQLIPPDKPVIHIDISPAEVGRPTRTEVGLAADARLALADLARRAADGAGAGAEGLLRRSAARLAAWREAAAVSSIEREADPCRRLRLLNTLMPDDAIVVSDGGSPVIVGGLLSPPAAAAFSADRVSPRSSTAHPQHGAQLADRAPRRRG